MVVYHIWSYKPRLSRRLLECARHTGPPMARLQVFLQFLGNSRPSIATNLCWWGAETSSLNWCFSICRRSSNIKVISFEVLLFFCVQCSWSIIALISIILLRNCLVVVQLSLRVAAVIKIVALDALSELVGCFLHVRIEPTLLLVMSMKRRWFLLPVMMHLA